jgi:hypothetical protein
MEFKMMTEICRISIGINKLDNEYTFYTDGTVMHEYDLENGARHVDEIHVRDIDTPERLELRKACKKEYKQKIQDLFNLY